MKRLSALLIMLLLLLGTVPAPAAEQSCLVPRGRPYENTFSDVPDGLWCAPYVRTVYETRLMEGFTQDRFLPGGNLTNAQITVVAARLYDLLTGGDGEIPAPADGESWYRGAYDLLADAGVLAQNTPGEQHTGLLWYDFQAADPCFRFFFAAVLSATVRAAGAELPALNEVERIYDLTGEEEDFPDILRFYNAGILNGCDRYGGLHGSSRLTRGEASAMLSRIVDPAQRLTFTLPGLDLCADVLCLAPDSPVLTVGGESFTAQQFAYDLCLGLSQSARPEDGLDFGVIRMKRTVAISRLGREQGLTPDSSAEYLLEHWDGYLGLSRSAWQWQAERDSYYVPLLRAYAERYGDKLYLAKLESDLDAQCAQLTVGFSAQFEALDLDALYQRAKELNIG
ncbi:S-layer homology domain-containing protein [Oscillibacter sp. MSJ-2]|uniref:S-layer homology domain-containing protein n=1 Tax=Dysosmobacter acutus TaxID=2841504 RepID=A0ABS6F676_9FIRM|nr:S-layer homology domain-containing protein [Dysosmobacter acutus]MBU5625770.1 S-layer homology domain-containing protein [Dysosmobacter acutus]